MFYEKRGQGPRVKEKARLKFNQGALRLSGLEFLIWWGKPDSKHIWKT